MSRTREKFATQVNAEILTAVRALAEKEGRQLQALVDEALTDLIEKHKRGRDPAPTSWARILPAMKGTGLCTRSSPSD